MYPYTYLAILPVFPGRHIVVACIYPRDMSRFKSRLQAARRFLYRFVPDALFHLYGNFLKMADVQNPSQTPALIILTKNPV